MLTFEKVIPYIKDNKLGAVTIITSLSYMFLGLPSQIWNIWQSQSVREISLPMFALLCLQSIFWVLYGFQKRDWFVITANAFGTLFSAAIVVEWFLFRA